jgi:hypothetical protein
MTENPDRIERTLELLLYAPLGVGMFLKDAAPGFVDMFVSRGRAEIDRRHGDVRRHVTTARSMGQVALAFGAPKLREKVERTVGDAYHRAEALLGSPASNPAPTRATAPPSPSPAAATPSIPVASTRPPRSESGWSGYPASGAATSAPSNGDAAARAGLPIPGYDALSASQVVERLVGLAPAELTAVHEYEAAHRQRRTILGKIEQLAG